MAKKTNKITKAPSGVSFMYAPRPAARKLRHTWNSEHDCNGIVSVSGPNERVSRNRPDAVEYDCTECDWTSPSGEFQHEPTTKTFHHVETGVVKKQKQTPDPVKLRNAFRKEHARRMRILSREREKFPPSLIEKGKGKRKRWVNNPDFTDAMRTHMHRFYVDAVEIRDALKNGDPLPKYPAAPKKKAR